MPIYIVTKTLVKSICLGVATLVDALIKIIMLLKDEKKYHGAVDKLSSEQQFRKSNTITFIVGKNWSPAHSGTMSYDRQASRQKCCKVRNFKFWLFDF